MLILNLERSSYNVCVFMIFSLEDSERSLNAEPCVGRLRCRCQQGREESWSVLRVKGGGQ